MQKIPRFDRMNKLLMALGFTKSKVDSNLYFKVEGRRSVLLLLCVNALFSRHGGVAEYRWNLPWTREVCSRDPKEIWDDGMQGYGHTYGIKLEAIKQFFIKFS